MPDYTFDANTISSMRLPDNRAESTQGGIDGLGTSWIPDQNHLDYPALVDNNNRLLDDIEEWTKIQWPDIDRQLGCILRSPTDSDAFQSGRYAEHNGRPKTSP